MSDLTHCQLFHGLLVLVLFLMFPFQMPFERGFHVQAQATMNAAKALCRGQKSEHGSVRHPRQFQVAFHVVELVVRYVQAVLRQCVSCDRSSSQKSAQLARSDDKCYVQAILEGGPATTLTQRRHMKT